MNKSGASVSTVTSLSSNLLLVLIRPPNLSSSFVTFHFSPVVVTQEAGSPIGNRPQNCPSLPGGKVSRFLPTGKRKQRVESEIKKAGMDEWL